MSIISAKSGGKPAIREQKPYVCKKKRLIELDLVKRTGSIVDVPSGKAMLGRVVDVLGVPI